MATPLPEPAAPPSPQEANSPPRSTPNASQAPTLPFRRGPWSSHGQEGESWQGTAGDQRPSHLPLHTPSLLTHPHVLRGGGFPNRKQAPLCAAQAAAARPLTDDLLEPQGHTPPPLHSRDSQRRGSEPLSGWARQFLRVSLLSPATPSQVALPQQSHPGPSPSLLDCGGAWSQLLAFLSLSSSLGAHSPSPRPHLLFRLGHSQLKLGSRACHPSKSLPQPRSLTLRARPLPAGSAALRCQAESNWLPGRVKLARLAGRPLPYPEGALSRLQATRAFLRSGVRSVVPHQPQPDQPWTCSPRT